MQKIGIDSPDMLYMDGTENAKKKGVIPRTEVRLKCINALTRESLGDNFTVPFNIAVPDVTKYLRTLARSAAAIINAVHNGEACSYTICGIEKDDDLVLSEVLTNALHSAIASDAITVMFVFYHPDRDDNALMLQDDLEIMSVLIQMFYICAIRVSDVYFANKNVLESAREKHPEYFKDICLEPYLYELRQNMTDILTKEGVLNNE